MSSRSPRTPRLAVVPPAEPAANSTNSEQTDSRSQKSGDNWEQKIDLKEWLRSKTESFVSTAEVGETESPARGECGDCGLHGREIALHIAVLETKLSDETQAKNRFSLAVSEYEKQILEKDREAEILRLEKQEIELECDGLKEQLEITSKHLDAIEISFNDVHEKYERAKQTIQILYQNVETLKNSIAEHDLCISQKHEQYLMLKEHAMERMDFANSQLDLIERKYSLETSKLRAAVKEAELSARSLSDQLEQRNRDNTELTRICDGLIEKMDSQNSIVSDNQSIHNSEPLFGKLRF